MAGTDGRKKEFARWPKFQAAYIRAFERCLEKRKVDEVKAEWRAGDMFDWWMQDRREKEDHDQTIMFE